MAIRVAYLTCEGPGRLDSVRGLKQPRLVPQGGAMSTQTMEPRLELEQNLHMYRQMAKIRAFDEQVNELYKSAKMPGLAHRSEEHTSELQSHSDLVCRLL